jgi:mRNA-degrading endonuclease RelE of RelBE toxin-antitoxin system
MVNISMSPPFREAAVSLSKDAKVKLIKVFHLLGENPRHPSLQLKKIQGARRPDIYECRVDQSLRMIVRLAGDTGIELVYVGTHDDAIKRGSRVCEEAQPYGRIHVSEERVTAFLEGDSEALVFYPIAERDLADLLGAGLLVDPEAGTGAAGHV